MNIPTEISAKSLINGAIGRVTTISFSVAIVFILLMGSALAALDTYEGSYAHEAAFKGSIYQMKTADLDGDGCDEIVMRVSSNPTGINGIMVLGYNATTDAYSDRTIVNLAVPGGFEPRLHDNIFIADINADGLGDILTISSQFYSTNTTVVPLLYNRTTGGFDTEAPFMLSDLWDPFVPAYLNSDSYPDLIYLSKSAPCNTLKRALWDNTTRSYSPLSGSITSALNITRLSATDLDGDGFSDIVAITNDTSRQLIYSHSTGGGTFGSSRTLSIPTSADALFLEDQDGDGDKDVLVLDRTSYSLSNILYIFENTGDGNLTGKKTMAIRPITSSIYQKVFFEDLDADDDLDMVYFGTPSPFSARTGVITYMNNGDNNFTTGIPYSIDGQYLAPVHGTSWAGPNMAVCLDLTGGTTDWSLVYVMKNHQDKTGRNSGFLGMTSRLQLVDSTKKEMGGLVIDHSSYGNGDIYVDHGSRMSKLRHLRALQYIPIWSDPNLYSNGNCFDVGDVCGGSFDVLSDIVVGNYSSMTSTMFITIYRGLGAYDIVHTFYANVDISIPNTCATGWRDIALGDLNGDGYDDVLALTMPSSSSNCDLTVAFNDASKTGAFTHNADYGIGVWTTDIDVVDVDCDGDNDVVLVNQGDTTRASNVTVLFNDGTGALTKRMGFFGGRVNDLYKLEMEDIDLDGDIDMVLTSAYAYSTIYTALNNGSGGFGSLCTYNPQFANDRVALGLVDGDVYPDLICYLDCAPAASSSTSSIKVYLNDATGHFRYDATLGLPGSIMDAALADIDQDSDDDMVLSYYMSSDDTHGILLIGNNHYSFASDSDGDSYPDDWDAFPSDPTEWLDSDADGYGDNMDDLAANPYEHVDSDGDGHGDQFDDDFPSDPTEWCDSDSDGWGDNSDAFPSDSTEWRDSDGDGVGDNADFMPYDATQHRDTDGDGHGDNASGTNGDMFQNNSMEWWDTDADGVGDNSDDITNDPAASRDTDSDGRPDEWNPGMSQGDSTTGLTLDVFPLDPQEWDDSDSDGIGDNSDVFPFDGTQSCDSDGDGHGDNRSGTNGDVFQFDPLEWYDTDGDGHGDNSDAFPSNSTEWVDTDGDGWGDNSDVFVRNPNEWQDSDFDGHGDNSDAFPTDPDEWQDSDSDGHGDNSDVFPTDPDEWVDSDGDGHGDNSDAFPDDPDEWQDSDSDGHGDVSDEFPTDPNEWIDSDGDGWGDSSDAFDRDPLEWSDNDADGIGDNADHDDDNDGYTDDVENGEGTDPLRATSVPADNDGDGVPDSTDNDDDDDGYTDAMENAYGTNPLDATISPADNDGDGLPDLEDGDDDNDGTLDRNDAFPMDAAADTDSDSDGMPDTLIAGLNSTLTLDSDDDNDGYVDELDAFPLNPRESHDSDNDGIGDNADTDDDNDGYSDTIEAFAGTNPLSATSRPLDTDGDMMPDIMDTDDDNDGWVDVVELRASSDPLDPLDVPRDSDNDGILDYEDLDLDGDGYPNRMEENVGTLPDNSSSVPQDADNDLIPDLMDDDDDNDGAPDALDFKPNDRAVQSDPNEFEVPLLGLHWGLGDILISVVISMVIFLVGVLLVLRKKLLYRKLISELRSIDSQEKLDVFSDTVTGHVEKENITVSHSLAIREEIHKKRNHLMVESSVGGALPVEIRKKLDDILEDNKVSREEMVGLRQALSVDHNLTPEEKRNIQRNMQSIQREAGEKA